MHKKWAMLLSSLSLAASIPAAAGSLAGANGKTVSDAHGWLDSATVTRGGGLLAEAVGATKPFLNVNLHVMGLASASAGPIECAVMVLDETEPYEIGASQNTLRTASLQKKFDASNAFGQGRFVKFATVKVIDHRNQKFCVVSSLEPAQSSSPVTASFGADTHFLGTLYESTDYGPDDPRFTTLYAPNRGRYPNSVVYAPVRYECASFRWPSVEQAAATRKMLDKHIADHSFEKFVASGVALEGVRPMDEKGVCTFSSLRVLAPGASLNASAGQISGSGNAAAGAAPAAAPATGSSGKPNGQGPFAHVYVTGYSFTPGSAGSCEAFEKMKKPCPAAYKMARPATLGFILSPEEVERLGLDQKLLSGRQLARFRSNTPSNAAALADPRGKRITLINAALIPGRGTYLFEVEAAQITP